MQSVSTRFWTRVAVSISYDDNHYTTVTSTIISLVLLLVDLCSIVLRNVVVSYYFRVDFYLIEGILDSRLRGLMAFALFLNRFLYLSYDAVMSRVWGEHEKGLV